MEARQITKSMWKHCWGYVRSHRRHFSDKMPDSWCKQENLGYYLAWLRLGRRDLVNGDYLSIPAPDRLWQKKVIDEILSEIIAERKYE